MLYKNACGNVERDVGTVVIEGKEVQRSEYRGQPVLTLAQIDELHHRPQQTAHRNFKEHRKQFINDEDFFDVPYREWRGLLIGRNSSDQTEKRGGRRGYMIFLTESGYLLLMKSFNDELAWKVQRALVNCYFRAKREAAASTGPEAPPRRLGRPPRPKGIEPPKPWPCPAPTPEDWIIVATGVMKIVMVLPEEALEDVEWACSQARKLSNDSKRRLKELMLPPILGMEQ